MSRRKLSELQRRRISRRQADLVNRPDGAPLQVGQVVARLGRHAEVRAASGDLVHCDIRASLSGDIVCGDWVQWWQQDTERGVIEHCQERRSALRRPGSRGESRVVAANLDKLFIVAAVRPAHDTRLLDQYLVNAEYSGIEPVLVLNKCDLPESEAARAALGLYEDIGYQVLYCSASDGAGLDVLRATVDRSTCALVGQSGVGKSSLISQLVPEADPAIGSLSVARAVGRHTTTTARMYPFADNGWLIDAPGIREFPLMPMPREELQRCFPDFRALLGACRFHNCRHEDEPGCALRDAVQTSAILAWRLEHFREFAASMEEFTKR